MTTAIENELRRRMAASDIDRHDRVAALSEALCLIVNARKQMMHDLIGAASSVIDNWDDWDGEAQQAAQHDQDERSWRHVMLTHIVDRVWRELGMPMEEM